MNKRDLAPEIILIENFWSPAKCRDFILKSESIGYEQAMIETDKGPILLESVRNNHRIMHYDKLLAEELWRDAAQFALKSIGLSQAVGLNELFRFYKYLPGQLFKKHSDQSFIRDEYESSYYTFMIYLNDGYVGGETIFDQLSVRPQEGAALIFLHSLPHEGSEVKQGTKYVLRTDIMYRISENL